MLTEPVIKRLTLSRYLFELALQHVRAGQEVTDAACVNVLQDAIEIFFLAAFDHLNVNVTGRTDFPTYMDKLSEAVGYDLPYRRRLLEINRVRVYSKHDGIPPNRKEVDGYVSDARKFLEELCSKIFNVDYWSISLIDVLDDGAVKTLMKGAETAFNAGKHLECLIECRKAFYITFESDYDIQKDVERVGLLFGSRAPYYTRNKEYVDKNVNTPFDYIVLDHSGLDAELMKEGIDVTAFWNVWRLTPQVYRHKDDDVWLIKREPEKEDSEGIKERAGYVLSSIISVLLSRQHNRKMMKSITSGRYTLTLKSPETTVYVKADKTGPVAGKMPKGVSEVSVNYATRGLRDEDTYWNILHLGTEPFSLLIGFILEDELSFK